MPRASTPWAALLAVLLVPLAAPARAPLPPQPADVAYPTTAWPEAAPPAGVDAARLTGAFDDAFAAVGRSGLPDTRALLVVHRGVVVAERYAPGFTADTRFQSWSMAKTVTQALVAILVRRGDSTSARRRPFPRGEVPTTRAPRSRPSTCCT